jgi:hypothetical protein
VHHFARQRFAIAKRIELTVPQNGGFRFNPPAASMPSLHSGAQRVQAIKRGAWYGLPRVGVPEIETKPT